MTTPVTAKSTSTDETKANEKDQAAAAKASTNDAADTANDLGLTEGEYRALRDDAGVNQSAGLDDNVVVWEASPAGKVFLEGEADRQKAVEIEAKALNDATDDDGLDEKAAKYVEVMGKGDSAKKDAKRDAQAKKREEQEAKREAKQADSNNPDVKHVVQK